MRENQPGFIKIIVLAFLFLVFTLIFYSIKTGVNPSLNSNSHSTEAPSQTLNPAPTTQLPPKEVYPNTYTNTLYGYRIQYPKGWSVESEQTGGAINTASERDRGIILRNINKPGVQINIEVDGPENISRGSYGEWLKTVSSSQYFEVNKQIEINFAGQNAKRLEGIYAEGGPAENPVMHITNTLFEDPKHMNFYSILTLYPSNGFDEIGSFNETFESILQTFHFN